MSKSRNSRYKDYYDYDDEYVDPRKDKLRNKSQERRFERALRTKNVSDLLEEDEEEDDANLLVSK